MGAIFGAMEVPLLEGAVPLSNVEVLLDNIRSAWNVGSILRAADGAGVRHLHLCGISPHPDHPKVAKTALGAELSVPWSCHADGLEFCRRAKREGFHLWALEGGQRAKSLFSLPPRADSPLLLIVGNEITGIDPQLLEECEEVVCLPMSGEKGSLNVSVAFGIAIYQLCYGYTA